MSLFLFITLDRIDKKCYNGTLLGLSKDCFGTAIFPGAMGMYFEKERTMANAVNLPGDRLAGMMMDLCAKLRAENLTLDQFDLFLQHKNPFEKMGDDMFIRHVTVSRTRTPMEAIDATGRNKYLTNDAIKTMPRGEGDEAYVIFFKLGREVSDADLDKEYELRDLKPADPYTLAAVNEADPAFADEHPNGTHWQDVHGNWCYAAFGRWRDERHVGVYRIDDGWGDHWWFAGLRK